MTDETQAQVEYDFVSNNSPMLFDTSLAKEKSQNATDNYLTYQAKSNTNTSSKKSISNKKKSKRKNLSLLPNNWREQMLNKAVSPEFYHPLIITATTGLRPSELENGVEITTSESKICFKIYGTKKTATSGQNWRTITVEAKGIILADLYEHVRACRKPYIVQIDNKNRFQKYVKKLSVKLFPNINYIVTPYSFRHQLAADYKASPLPPDILAQILGHRSSHSRRIYGTARQGRKTFAKILDVKTSDPIRTPPSDEKRPWLNNNNSPQDKDKESDTLIFENTQNLC